MVSFDSPSTGGIGGVEDKEREKGFLSPDDWKLILKGTKCITCEPGKLFFGTNMFMF